MRLPVTEVERFTPRPGDVLFVHAAEKLSTPQADDIKRRITAIIGREDVKVVILPPGMTVKVGTSEAA